MTGDSDVKGWYDGQKLTFVSDSQKVWARVNAAANIDDTLDRLAERLAMPMPVADFLYRSPYDALIGKASTGGYVGRETVHGVACLHVAYQHPGADWDLWVAEQGDQLPKQFHVTDKTLTPPRTFEVVFDKWVTGCAGHRRDLHTCCAVGLRAHPRWPCRPRTSADAAAAPASKP